MWGGGVALARKEGRDNKKEGGIDLSVSLSPTKKKRLTLLNRAIKCWLVFSQRSGLPQGEGGKKNTLVNDIHLEEQGWKSHVEGPGETFLRKNWGVEKLRGKAESKNQGWMK